MIKSNEVLTQLFVGVLSDVTYQSLHTYGKDTNSFVSIVGIEGVPISRNPPLQYSLHNSSTTS